MIEKLNFNGFLTPEEEKIPFRRMIEKGKDAIADLKSSTARWVGLAAKNLSEATLDD